MPLANSFSFDYMLQGDTRVPPILGPRTSSFLEASILLTASSARATSVQAATPSSLSQRKRKLEDVLEASWHPSSLKKRQRTVSDACPDVYSSPRDVSPASPLPSSRPLPFSGSMEETTARLEDVFELTGTVLGSGQFGTVRMCTDRRTGEKLACKSIRKVSGSVRQQEEINGEVGIMARLACGGASWSGGEHVVQLRGVFEDEAEVHLVMDLCRGGELFDEVVRRECFSEADSAHLFFEIASAVAFCHAHGVIHRDLKPENIIFTRPLADGVPLAEQAMLGPLVKLSDFGLSATIANGERLHGTASSPFYMAPEVLTSEYDTKADVWSLGVILYILLSGVPPFWGETDDEVFEAVLRDPLDLSSSPWGCVTAPAKQLVKALLNRDPAMRPSAEQVLRHPWLRRHLAAVKGAEGCVLRQVRVMSSVPVV